MKIRISIFAFLLFFSVGTEAQEVSNLSIYETLNYINTKLKSNPPDTSSYYEIDINYYGQLIIFLHDKPYMKEIRSFARFPIKSVTIDVCRQGINQLAFTSNGDQKVMITGTDISKKYKQAFLRFENVKNNNCESIRNAFVHLFQLVSNDPLYQEKDASYDVPTATSPVNNSKTTNTKSTPTTGQKKTPATTPKKK